MKYTGHPFIDVGAATITAFVDKRDPSRLTSADLDQVVKYIERNYTRPPLIGFFQGAVFPNSGYCNPGIKGKRADYYGWVLHAYRGASSAEAEPCVACGNPSVQRIARDYFPLLTGRDVINFFPWGESGLPLCDKCLLAIQAFPLGCAKVAGRLLAVHSDDNALTFAFAKKFLEGNLSAIQVAQHAKDTKLAEAKYSVGTLLIQTLVDVQKMRQNRQNTGNGAAGSLTAYHLSNSGQSPSLDIYHLPLQVMGFLHLVLGASYQEQWERIVKSAWQIAKDGPVTKKEQAAKKKKTSSMREGGAKHNYLYEDVLKLPDQAHRFIRIYFLRQALHYARQDDPRGNYSTRNQSELVSWRLTQLFLEEVMSMDKERIEHIRELGNRLAAFISSENDRRFFIAFYSEQKYPYFRNALVKANLDAVRLGQAPLITFDQFIEVFEIGEDSARPDWRLARDLVLIRMIEQLYQRGWLAENREALPEAQVLTTEKENGNHKEE